jgi:hypothetical protein
MRAHRDVDGVIDRDGRTDQSAGEVAVTAIAGAAGAGRDCVRA